MAVSDEDAEARLDEVRLLAQAHGGKLISTSYQNAHAKLEFEDATGNRFFASRANVCRGKWSPYESGNVRHDPAWHLRELARIAASRGGRIISTSYKGAFVKLDFEDSQRRRFSMMPTNIKKGRWSPYESGTVRHDHDWHLNELRSIAQRRGGKLISENYLGSQVPIEFDDAAGNRFKMRPSSVKQGSWSPFESGTVRDHDWHLTRLRLLASERGGRLISSKWEGKDTPLVFEDAEGRRFVSAPNNVRNGSWSPYEAGNSRDRAWHMQVLRELAKARGGKVVSDEYILSNEPMEFEDAAGNRFTSTAQAVKAGRWSPGEGRLGESLCRQVFEQVFGRPFPSTWRIIRMANGRALQLDGYAVASPGSGAERRLAFEYQGFHHFVDAFGGTLDRVQERDRFKREECARLEIILFEVVEFDFSKGIDGALFYEHVKTAISRTLGEHGIACPVFSAVFAPDLSTINHAVKQLEEIRAIAESRGGRLASSQWLGNATRHEFDDSAGRRFLMRPDVLKRGSWSPYEAGCSRDPVFHLSELAKFAHRRGGRLIGNVYQGCDTPIEFEDVSGERFWITPPTVKRGKWTLKETPARGANVRDTDGLRRIVTADGHTISYKRDTDGRLKISEHEHPSGLERRIWRESHDGTLVLRYHRAALGECYELQSIRLAHGATIKESHCATPLPRTAPMQVGQ